jgi:hypothetical protein
MQRLPRFAILLGSLALGHSAHAQLPVERPVERVAALAQPVDANQMRRTVQALVSFGTRHTLSSQTHPRRGIGASLEWTRRQFQGYSKACGNCLTIVDPWETFTGTRLPAPTRVRNMMAVQLGTERPDDVVIITGHIDSRVTDVMNATADAPGANDDGSGTAAVLEAARVLSRHKFPATIVYAALSGEEQGLYGAKVLANYAKAQGWNVVANLNNDIIGNSCGSDGVCNDRQVRVFSEGPRWQGHEDFAARIRSLGGENDAPSRNISRLLDWLADRLGPNLNLDVLQVWRNDRFGRGGDHTELLNAGYPAVRLSVAVENYNHQHQDLRVEDGIQYGDTIDKMDFAYLAKVTKLNVAALAWLASAPPPPVASVEGAVSTDTTITWTPVAGAARYLIRWRRTDANQWDRTDTAPFSSEQEAQIAKACQSSVPADLVVDCGVRSVGKVLKGVRVDDWVFGVAAVSKEGFESPVSSAVPGGAFKPYAVTPTP